LCVLADDTERRRDEAALAHRATHDALTGLPNRALLEDRLQQAQARQRRQSEPLAMLFVDLDNLKQVNDEYGHGAGDELLIAVGQRLRNVVRAADTVARLGGDEFVLMCEGLDEAGATELVQRIRDAVCVPLALAGAVVAVEASIGVAHAHEPDEQLNVLLARADAAMYHDKRHRIRGNSVRL
jgi:diguanylate cyclase (GGDEF)-like protein